MAVIDQKITDLYSLYNGDSVEVLKDLPSECVGISVYSPPFAKESGGALYHYSSSERDLSNSRTYEEFFEHYAYIVRELYRIMIPGRICCVHTMDVPNSNNGDDDYTDFPGDIIRLHKKLGFRYKGRHCIWKEPLGVRNRTMTKHLMHSTIVADSVYSGPAGADFLLLFQKKGKNPIPVAHPEGLMHYAGEREIPPDLLAYRGYTGKQTENKYSHWIWRSYASSFWDDIRLSNVVPYEEARDEEDEKHVHPLQLDVIERCLILYSNPGDVLCSPFMGVGSEIYSAVISGRKGVGAELKPSYYRQSVKNMEIAESKIRDSSCAIQPSLL